MAATLRIRLRNETPTGVADLRDDLEVTADAADHLSDTMGKAAKDVSAEVAALRREQSQEIKIIHEQRAGWSSLAQTAVPALTSMTVAGVKYAETLAILAAKQKYLETLMSPLQGSQTALNLAYNLGSKAAVRGAAELAGYGTMAARVGTILGVTTVAVKGFEFWLAHTGKTAKGTRRDWSQATDEQRAAFKALEADAKSLGVTVETVMQAAGKSLKDFGGRDLPVVETNLDRVRKSTSLLRDDVIAFGKGGVDATRELGKVIAQLALKYEPTTHSLSVLLPIAMRKTEEAGARLAFNLSEGMKQVGQYIRGVKYEALEAARKLDELQNRTKDDFARVRITEAQATAAAKERAEAERVAGIATTQAVDAEIQKLKDRRGIQAANNEFDEEAAKKYLSTLESLERRRGQILDQRQREEADARRKQLDEERQQSVEIQKLYSQAFEDRNAKILKENAEYERALDEEVKAVIQQHQRQEQEFQKLTAAKAQEAQKQRDTYVARWREAVSEVADLISGKAAGKEGPNQIDQIRNSLKQRDVARQVGTNRAHAAVEDFNTNANEWRNRLRDQGISGDEAEARINHRRRQIERQAFASGFGDVVRGRATQDEIAGAQNQMIGAVVQNAAASGELAPVVAQGLVQAAQQAIQATQQSQQALAIAKQVQNALNANAQRTRATNGSLKR